MPLANFSKGMWFGCKQSVIFSGGEGVRDRVLGDIPKKNSCGGDYLSTCTQKENHSVLKTGHDRAGKSKLRYLSQKCQLKAFKQP